MSSMNGKRRRDMDIDMSQFMRELGIDSGLGQNPFQLLVESAHSLLDRPHEFKRCLQFLPSSLHADIVVVQDIIDILIISTDTNTSIHPISPSARSYTAIAAVSLPSNDDDVLNRPQHWLPHIAELLRQQSRRNPQSRLQNLRLLRQLAHSHRVLPVSLQLRQEDIRLSPLHPVAGGSFSDVYQGEHNGNKVCVKAFRIMLSSEADRKRVVKDFYHEAILWNQLLHPNIHSLRGVLSSLDPQRPLLWLVSDWLDNGTILDYLKENPNANRINALAQISCALEYLHTFNPPVIHRDIKGSNILINARHECVLTDFGISSILDSATGMGSTTQMRGTLRWSAPERLLPDGYRQYWSLGKEGAVDMYAFGCVGVEIYTLLPPFHDIPADVTVLLNVLAGRRPGRPQHPDLDQNDKLWDLISKCWVDIPTQRLSAGEVLERLLQMDGCSWAPQPYGLEAFMPRFEKKIDRQVVDAAFLLKPAGMGTSRVQDIERAPPTKRARVGNGKGKGKENVDRSLRTRKQKSEMAGGMENATCSHCGSNTNASTGKSRYATRSQTGAGTRLFSPR